MHSSTDTVYKLAAKERHSIILKDKNIFEFKVAIEIMQQNEPNRLMKLLTLSDSTRLRILKTQILQKSTYRFRVRVQDEESMVDIILEGQKELQKFSKLVGQHGYLHGMQDFLSSLKKIGSGSFANVYLGTMNYQLQVALKCFEKQAINKEEKNKKAFQNELQILKILNSKYIVAFDYVYETKIAYYLKMELFQRSLKQRIAEHMRVAEQKKLLTHILLALKQMCTKNIIHRDIKPQNIMIRCNADGSEQCVLIDFGLATVTTAQPYLFHRCGTPGFLSPELANLVSKAQKQKTSSDMFSVGCVFYRMLTKKYLFHGKTAKEVLNRNKKCLYDRDSFALLSTLEQDLLIKMLETNESKRITPSEALRHPYFKQEIDDEDQIPEESHEIKNKMKKLRARLTKNMSSVTQSQETSLTSLQHNNIGRMSKSSLKDSCITFQVPNYSLPNSTVNDSRKSKTKKIRHIVPMVKRRSRFSARDDLSVEV